MHFVRTVIAALALLLLATLNTRAAIVVAEFAIPPTGTGVSTSLGFQSVASPLLVKDIGQSFVPTQSGILDDISILIDQSPPSVGGEDVILGLYTTNAGGLPASLLGSATILEGAVPASSPDKGQPNLSVDFLSQNITLTAGTQYAWIATVPTAAMPAGNPRYFVGAQTGVNATYADGTGIISTNGGANFSIENNGDRPFRVTIIPEPSAVSLFALALAAGLRRRRSRGGEPRV